MRHNDEIESEIIEDRLIKLRTVAGKLDICVRNVWRLIASGELPKPVKVGRSARLYESEVRSYLEKLKNQRTTLSNNHF
jgi:excisionase family DNA binding protein